MKPYYHHESEIAHVIPPLIAGAPTGASASIRCDNGAVYDRHEVADGGTLAGTKRCVWKRRAGCGPREVWDTVEPIQTTML